MLDETIELMGHKADAYYRKRSMLVIGKDGDLYRRTLKMINYHISEVLADAHHHHSKFESNQFDHTNRQFTRS